MGFKKIHVENYKCFGEIDVSLNNFNLIIGQNASGKSSFIQIFKFLKDLGEYGLDNAIALQGGVEYFRNLNIGSNKNFNLEVVFETKKNFRGAFDNDFYFSRGEVKYNLQIYFPRNSKKYKVISEEVSQEIIFEKKIKKDGKKNEKHRGSISVTRTEDKINYQNNFPQEIKQFKKDFNFPFIGNLKFSNTESILLSPFTLLPFPSDIFDYINIYDFDPRLSKKAIPFTGQNALLEDGGNIAIILNKLFKNKTNKKKFVLLLNDILPFFNDTKTEKLTDKSYIFSMKEKYLQKKYLPSSFLSDGTINIISLILALFFQSDSNISIFEEPERNLHPSLISKLISQMKDASSNKQIILTTHNPEILRHCKVDDMLFVKRDDKGFSKIESPNDMNIVKQFLENEIGIDELFIQNMIL